MAAWRFVKDSIDLLKMYNIYHYTQYVILLLNWQAYDIYYYRVVVQVE